MTFSLLLFFRFGSTIWVGGNRERLRERNLKVERTCLQLKKDSPTKIENEALFYFSFSDNKEHAFFRFELF